MEHVLLYTLRYAAMREDLSVLPFELGAKSISRREVARDVEWHLCHG